MRHSQTMPESYVLRGLIIGIVFGVPAGIIGVLSIQRSLSQEALAGFMTGIDSSAADDLYACVGVFGISLISDFLLKNQCFICLAGSNRISGRPVPQPPDSRIQP